ncbi:hypothetical protein SAMN02910368_02124 [Lachnospiraceae bacterium G11]|nr:hypothetical protein SAMN02910368_02124 [Lachnospiraceae bacterium G11]
MEGLKRMLEEEQKRLAKIRKEVEKELKHVPDGTLRVTRSNKVIQYMHCTPENERSRTHGKYIKKSELNLAAELARKEYNLKLQKLVNRRLSQIEKLNKEYSDDETADVYRNLNLGRKKLILPIEELWEQRYEEWKNKEYVGKGFAPGVLEIYSKRGERVRSKSEKILADMFYDMGIDYKYECPLYLEGVGTVYPDFTFLSKRLRKEIYWEHDGRMDDPDYANSAIRKIDSYIKNGIYPGENLIVTYESSNYTLNDKVARSLAERFLL